LVSTAATTAITPSTDASAITITTSTDEPTTSGPTASDPTASDSGVDEGLAATALLEPDDVAEDWGSMGEELIFPNSAEIARPIAACKPYAEIVFEGGSQHGVGKSGVISNSPNPVFLYTAVFETVEQASAMLDAVSSAGFDECWARFNEAAVLKMPTPITNPKYAPETPPNLALVADASTVKFLVGTLEFSGSEVPDTCVCIFARVGRGVVEVHSAEATLTLEQRIVLTQLAIDKMQRVLAAAD
jgi:hypothetical protein